jgi:hypothetical protein
LVAELIESLATGRSDLRVDSIEERESCQQVLTRTALTAGVLTTRPTGAADRLVKWQSLQPTRSPMMANFSMPSGPTAGEGSNRPATN